MEQLLAQMSSLDQSSFKGNAKGYRAVFQAAQQLVRRLERPWECMMRMTFTQPFLLAALYSAIQMDLFDHLDEHGKTTAELAAATGADVELLARLLRMLGSCDVVEECTEHGHYTSTSFSIALRDRQGIASGIHHFYDIGVPQMAKLPVYLRQTNFRNPTDTDHPPWEFIMESRNYWAWYKDHPEAHAHFNTFMNSLRVQQSPWIKSYPVSERLLDDLDIHRPLLVDIGGGEGKDVKALELFLRSSRPDARYVLQDTQETLDGLNTTEWPPQIDRVPHNFFAPQPAGSQGAKAYLLHSVLHDWPDAQAKEILERVKDAMTPGYSKLLVFEAILPERVAEVSPVMAAMDLHMMANFAASERTEEQWRRLFESAGLRYVVCHGLRAHNYAIMEVER